MCVGWRLGHNVIGSRPFHFVSVPEFCIEETWLFNRSLRHLMKVWAHATRCSICLFCFNFQEINVTDLIMGLWLAPSGLPLVRVINLVDVPWMQAAVIVFRRDSMVHDRYKMNTFWTLWLDVTCDFECLAQNFKYSSINYIYFDKQWVVKVRFVWLISLMLNFLK